MSFRSYNANANANSGDRTSTQEQYLVNLMRDFRELLDKSKNTLQPCLEMPSETEFIFNLIKKAHEIVSASYPQHPNDEKKYYIFGGYVRDLICGNKPNDIDIRLPTDIVLTEFVRLLSLSGRLYSISRSSDGTYGSIKVEVNLGTGTENNLIKLDLTTPHALNNCIDFTVNNLILTPDGEIGVRIVPKQWDRVKVLSECLKDCRKKRIRWMVPQMFESLYYNCQTIDYEGCVYGRKYLKKFEARFNHMLAKDFTYEKYNAEKRTKQTLTGFTLKHRATIKDLFSAGILKNDEDLKKMMCVICSDSFETESVDDTKNMCILSCGHIYHTWCIGRWARENGQNIYTDAQIRCPTCNVQRRFIYVTDAPCEFDFPPSIRDRNSPDAEHQHDHEHHSDHSDHEHDEEQLSPIHHPDEEDSDEGSDEE